MDLIAGTFVVNREPGRCTMVSQVRVTSVGACQTTYRSTKLESLADETRPAGLLLHCSCTIHEIVRQGFGATERHATLLMMMILTRRGTSSWTVEFCSCRWRRCVLLKSKNTKRRGISSLQSTLYLALYEISLHTHKRYFWLLI